MAQGEPREERLGVVEEAPSAGEGERIEVAAGPGVGAGVGLVGRGAPGEERGGERSSILQGSSQSISLLDLVQHLQERQPYGCPGVMNSNVNLLLQN